MIEQPTQIQWCMTYKTFLKTFNYLIPSSYCRNHTLKYYKSRILIFLIILWHTKHIFSKLYFCILWHTKHIFQAYIFIFYDTPNTFFQGYIYIFYDTPNTFLWLYFYILWHTKHIFSRLYFFILWHTKHIFCGYIFIFYDTINTFLWLYFFILWHTKHIFLWLYFYILWHTQIFFQDYTAKKKEKKRRFFKENLTITDVHWFYEKYVSITSRRLEGWLLGVCKTFVFVSCREWPLINIVRIRQPIPKLHKQQDENNPSFSESQNIKKN